MDNRANAPSVSYRIEVTLGEDADISVVEDEFTWQKEDECEFILRFPNGDKKILYGDLETSVDAMEHLKELGYVPDTI